MKKLKLVKKEEKITFKKIKDDKKGAVIAGWILVNNTGLWVKRLKELDNIIGVEEKPKINKDHITLYKSGRIIGWIEKEYKKEIKKMLQKYMKHNGKFIRNKNESKQLALF